MGRYDGSTILTTSFEQLRLEIGASGFLTDTQYKTLKATATKTWLTNLWEFADRFQIEIRDDLGQLQLQRQNDKLLMDEFIKAGYTGTQLKQLNKCRMFLHAVTLSDIVTIDGKEITINSQNGIKDDHGPLYQWPCTRPSLSIEHWNQWRRVLGEVFLISGNSRVLNKPLLEWKNGAPTKWKWYLHAKEDRLYAKEGLLWRVYSRHRRRISPRQGKSTYSKTKLLVQVPPEGLRPASVLRQGQIIIYQGAGAPTPLKTTTHIQAAHSFEEERLQREPLDQWAIQEITVLNDGRALAQALRKGTAIAVSDRSYKEGRGTAAFILKTSNNFEPIGQIVGVNIIPGETDNQSAYRSEIGGISGIVETIGILCTRHSIMSGAIEVSLNGDQAMKTIFGNGRCTLNKRTTIYSRTCAIRSVNHP